MVLSWYYSDVFPHPLWYLVIKARCRCLGRFCLLSSSYVRLVNWSKWYYARKRVWILDFYSVFYLKKRQIPIGSSNLALWYSSFNLCRTVDEKIVFILIQNTNFNFVVSLWNDQITSQIFALGSRRPRDFHCDNETQTSWKPLKKGGMKFVCAGRYVAVGMTLKWFIWAFVTWWIELNFDIKMYVS